MPKRKVKELDRKVEMTDDTNQPTCQSDTTDGKVEVEKTERERSSRKKPCSSSNSPSPQIDDPSADKASNPLVPSESSARSNQAVVGVSEEDIKRWAEFTIPPQNEWPIPGVLEALGESGMTEDNWNSLNPKAYVTPQEEVTPPELLEELDGRPQFGKGCDPFDKFFEGVIRELDRWLDDYWSTFDGNVNYVAEIEARLTAEQKQAIVDRLGNWCLFHDWDSLVAHFPQKEIRFEIFAYAIICKDIFDGVVKNPFYYMDLEEEWDGRADALPPPFGQELFKLWQKLRSIDEITADQWRSSTVRHLNRYGNPHTRDPELFELSDSEEVPGLYVENRTPGLRCYNIRQAYINQLVDNMLDKSSLLWLLGPPPDPARESDAKFTYHRRGLLRRMYASAAEGAIHMWASRASYIIDENVKEIPPFRVPQRPFQCKEWAKTWYHSHSFKYTQHDETLNGRRAVMVVWPTTWIVQREHGMSQQEVLKEILGPKFTEIPEWLYFNDLGWSHGVICPGWAHFASRGLLGCPLEIESSAAPEKKAANENAATGENKVSKEEIPTGTTETSSQK